MKLWNWILVWLGISKPKEMIHRVDESVLHWRLLPNNDRKLLVLTMTHMGMGIYRWTKILGITYHEYVKWRDANNVRYVKEEFYSTVAELSKNTKYPYERYVRKAYEISEGVEVRWVEDEELFLDVYSYSLLNSISVKHQKDLKTFNRLLATPTWENTNNR